MGDQSIICFTHAQWLPLMIWSIVAVVVEVVGFGSLLVYIIIVAPWYFRSSTAFQRRWKFLFQQHRSDVWWWAFPTLLRNCMLSVMLVIAHHGITQLYAMMSVILCYAFAATIFRPWRHKICTFFDIPTCGLLSLVRSLLAWLAHRKVDRHSEDRTDVEAVRSWDSIDNSVVCLTYAPLVICSFLCCYSCVAHRRKRKMADDLRFGAMLQSIASYKTFTAQPIETVLDKVAALGEWDLGSFVRVARVISSQDGVPAIPIMVSAHSILDSYSASLRELNASDHVVAIRQRRSLKKIVRAQHASAGNDSQREERAAATPDPVAMVLQAPRTTRSTTWV